MNKFINFLDFKDSFDNNNGTRLYTCHLTDIINGTNKHKHNYKRLNHKLLKTKAAPSPIARARAEDILLAAPGASVGAVVSAASVPAVVVTGGGTSVDPADDQSPLQRGVSQLQK